MSYERLDLLSDPELAGLTELFRAGSAIDEPAKMLTHFAGWFGRKRRADFFVSISKRDLPEGRYKITRRIQSIERDAASAPNPWREWDNLQTYQGGLIGELIARPEPQFLTGLNIQSDPVLGDAIQGLRTAMAIPTFHRGEALNWAISFYKDAVPRDLAFVRGAMLDINMLGMATRNLVSRREAESLNTRLRVELEKIAAIQRSLLPQRLPHIPGLDVAVSYLTSDQAGGDYYDFFELPEGRWGVLIADVAGHGAGAATVMAMLRAILHCYERIDPSPASVMDFANQKLVAANLMGTFVTAFYAVYDPKLSVLEFARCGHNPPRLRKASGEVVELDGDAGLPLGIVDQIGVHTAAMRFLPGDTLVLYTDGITEAFDPAHDMFGVHRLDNALRQCSGVPDCAVDSIHSALYHHTGVMDRHDDQTLVVLHRLAQATPPVDLHAIEYAV